MLEKYDVIIIGAGPAGLNCAYHLQDSRKKVLLLEKNDVIGPKVCAGGLTQKDLDYLNLPPSIIGRSFKELTYKAGNLSTVIKFNKPFIYTIDRKQLGEWQLEKIHSGKIDIIKNTTVIDINNDYIETSSGNKYCYKYLVGADGSASLVRRYLNIKTNILGIGIQYIISSHNYNNIELHYNSKLFASWYAWIFPHRDFVSIGTGGNPKIISSKTLRENLTTWMKLIDIDYSSGKFEAFPINNDYQGYKFDNIFLAGDAAGLASEFNGEGIYQALISGEEIAHTIINDNYIPKKLYNVLENKKRHTKVVQILNKAGILRPLLLALIGLGFRSKYITKKSFKYILK